MVRTELIELLEGEATECVMDWSNHGRDGGGRTCAVLRTRILAGEARALLGTSRREGHLNPNFLAAEGDGLHWPG